MSCCAYQNKMSISHRSKFGLHRGKLVVVYKVFVWKVNSCGQSFPKVWEVVALSYGAAQHLRLFVFSGFTVYCWDVWTKFDWEIRRNIFQHEGPYWGTVLFVEVDSVYYVWERAATDDFRFLGEQSCWSEKSLTGMWKGWFDEMLMIPQAAKERWWSIGSVLSAGGKKAL